ncbi:hypothetical protein OE88DRAFT_1652209 [Heliocybe sulcata]|uniref:Uncharacterized protein n=1 Tax=Heliocybe sulcata TaxID=5364 RepID=A0A5C3NFL4_9AGAM|nr:hypothetical protein OE88DRAFT_1652209 [Heliocybe sulcata]
MYHRFMIVSEEPGTILQTQGIPLDPSVEDNPVPGPSRHRSSSHGHGAFSSNPTRFNQLNFQSYDGQNTRRASFRHVSFSAPSTGSFQLESIPTVSSFSPLSFNTEGIAGSASRNNYGS